MWRELLGQDVERALDVLGPLVDDIEVGVRLDEAAGGCADGAAHVGYEESANCEFLAKVLREEGELVAGDGVLPVGLGADLVDDGAEDGPVALQELRAVWVRDVEVKGRVLRLQDGQEATAEKRLSVRRGAEVVRRIPAGRDVCDLDYRAKGVLYDVSNYALLRLFSTRGVGFSAYIVKADGSEEVLMLVIPGPRPEVPDFLRLDVRAGEWRAGERGQGRLEDRQRRHDVAQGLGDSRDGGDEAAGDAEVERRRDGEGEDTREEGGGLGKDRHGCLNLGSKRQKDWGGIRLDRRVCEAVVVNDQEVRMSACVVILILLAGSRPSPLLEHQFPPPPLCVHYIQGIPGSHPRDWPQAARSPTFMMASSDPSARDNVGCPPARFESGKMIAKVK